MLLLGRPHPAASHLQLARQLAAAGPVQLLEKHASAEGTNRTSLLATAQGGTMSSKSLAPTPRVIIIPVIMQIKAPRQWI